MEHFNIFALIFLIIEIALMTAILYIPYKLTMRLIRGMIKTAKKTWNTIVE